VRNPWLRKNPFLSIWLSGANAVAGAARGKATAYAKKQMASAMAQNTKTVSDFWLGALAPPAPRKRKKRR
jgi:hypothetical protein